MTAWDRLRGLSLVVEAYELEGLELGTNSGYLRRSTLVHLEGAGERGTGEEVAYRAEDQEAFQRRGPSLPLAGGYTLESFSARLDRLDLFPDPPGQEAYRDYRRWAFESAALDLALRQNALELAAAVGEASTPLHFSVSLGLDRFEPVAERLAIDPEMRFKLDATPAWDERLCAALAETGKVDVIDFKGAYHGTPVDTPANLALYDRVLAAFGDAVIFEDPHDHPEVIARLRDHAARVAWDAPIHSIADVDAMPLVGGCLNVKPSRFGTLERLFAVYPLCRERGLRAYGGGQFELGCGRQQIQLLAALFHADAPNDVAPRGYHQLTSPEPRPASPLTLCPRSSGFAIGEE